MNKRSFFQIGCLPVIFLILCACKGNGCSGNDCDEICKPYRQFLIQANDSEIGCFLKQLHDNEITAEEFSQKKTANYQFLAEHQTLSWEATDKHGEIIGGILKPYHIDLEIGSIQYKLGKNDKWLQDLETPPVFTIHVDGGDYEDAVFTIDETFFSTKIDNPKSNCNGLYPLGDYVNNGCLILYKKQPSCSLEETANPSEWENLIHRECVQNGFKLLQPEDEAHE